MVINPNTLLRWLEIPEFRDAYRKGRREGVQQSVARLQQATGAAAITILKLMTDPSAPPAVRLRAPECVFDRAIQGIEIEDIEARVPINCGFSSRKGKSLPPSWRGLGEVGNLPIIGNNGLRTTGAFLVPIRAAND